MSKTIATKWIMSSSSVVFTLVATENGAFFSIYIILNMSQLMACSNSTSVHLMLALGFDFWIGILLSWNFTYGTLLKTDLNNQIIIIFILMI